MEHNVNRYNPRFINDAGLVNERFITLRSHLNESGISGQLFDRMSLDDIIELGHRFIRRTRDGEPKETLTHIAIYTEEFDVPCEHGVQYDILKDWRYEEVEWQENNKHESWQMVPRSLLTINSIPKNGSYKCLYNMQLL